MHLVSYSKDGVKGLAFRKGSDLIDLKGCELSGLLEAGEAGFKHAAHLALYGPLVDESSLSYLPPIAAPPKIVCVGLNYKDHVNEAKRAAPSDPTFFGRFTRSVIGHGQTLIRPSASEQFDYEGEIAAVIGKGGRHISREQALDHVAGYSVFNDASVRDYQRRGEQWTLGKNFDSTGAFGPDFVTADELPAGARGLRLVTRLNGVEVQSATAEDMIFDVATLIVRLSEVMTLEVGDVIVTGTPGGVGFARVPKLFMKDGDVCEVELEGVGTLRNPVKDETAPRSTPQRKDLVDAR
ncbi:MAG: fumarylacetoacetate hydrolase family protein [Acidobacteriota bacterium]|nr:fumarylacetoacetate hydrolase family protein [Acidobacteriota bacterium]